jgi:hypothetical protein
VTEKYSSPVCRDLQSCRNTGLTPSSAPRGDNALANGRRRSEQTLCILESSVSMAISFRFEERGVGIRVPIVTRIFLFFKLSRPALRPTQPLIKWVPRAISPGVNRQQRKANHSSQANVAVKKIWIYTYTCSKILTFRYTKTTCM